MDYKLSQILVKGLVSLDGLRLGLAPSLGYEYEFGLIRCIFYYAPLVLQKWTRGRGFGYVELVV